MDIVTTAAKHVVLDRESSLTALESTVNKKESLSYERLIAPIETQMMRSIWRIVRNREAAEDTMQNALTTIWKKLDRIRRHPNPHAFILKVCVNAAYDTLRRSWRFRQHEASMEIQKLPADPDTNGLYRLEKKNLEIEILNAIRRLPRNQALAVLMRIVQDQPYDFIAQVMDCSEVTVRIHVSKGRAKLSRWLSHLDPTGPEETKNESKE